jgi:hypothetical protein
VPGTWRARHIIKAAIWENAAAPRRLHPAAAAATTTDSVAAALLLRLLVFHQPGLLRGRRPQCRGVGSGRVVPLLTRRVRKASGTATQYTRGKRGNDSPPASGRSACRRPAPAATGWRGQAWARLRRCFVSWEWGVILSAGSGCGECQWSEGAHAGHSRPRSRSQPFLSTDAAAHLGRGGKSRRRRRLWEACRGTQRPWLNGLPCLHDCPVVLAGRAAA